MTARRGDPIAAAATPPGGAERAIVRISGAGLLAQAAALFGPELPVPNGRRARVRGLVEWSHGAKVDVQALAFPGPGSATGEDVLELHLPGSAPVVAGVLERLRAAGIRAAEPGEFTRRAFLNGRIDLTQAEAVLDLVHARSAAAGRAAALVLAGSLGGLLQAARDALVDALAEIEAGLDFEEGDAQDLQPGEITAHLAAARTALTAGMRGEQRRALGEGDFRIALWGAPNAGKSRLFAWLTGAPVLVSAEAGTTRDRLEAVWMPAEAELPWRLVDGPGTGGRAVDARDAAARVVRERARRLEEVDLWWLVVDAADAAARIPVAPPGAAAMVVFTHADLPRAVAETEIAAAEQAFGPAAWVSPAADLGRADLAARTAAAAAEASADREVGSAALARHGAALASALSALTAAETLVAAGGPGDLVAEELRAALQPLGELVGRLTPEALLDRVFARFCIGK
ncbi:MAG TPA: GTPase [Planctomycetota bacterium]